MFLLCSLILLSSTVVLPVNAQMCLPNLPSFIDPGNDAPLVDYQTQVIVTSYQFNCCGEVTEWGAFVQPGGRLDVGMYSIRFQVWRPSGQCFSEAGQNEFTSVSLNPNSVIRETPLDTKRIRVQPGDVVGFYLNSPKRAGRNGRGVQLDKNRDQEDVWYGDIGSDGSCPFSIGDSTLLSTNLAPILHVVVSTTECPVSSSTTVKHITTTPYMTTTVTMSLVVEYSTFSTVLGDNMPTTPTYITLGKRATIVISPSVLPTPLYHTTTLPGEQVPVSNTQNMQGRMSSVTQTHNTRIPAIPTRPNQLHIILPVFLSVLMMSISLIVIGGIWVTWKKKRWNLISRRKRNVERRSNNYPLMNMSAMNPLNNQERTVEEITAFVNVEPYAMREDWDTSSGRINSEPNRSLGADGSIKAYAVRFVNPSHTVNDITTEENIAYNNRKGARDSAIRTTSNQAYTTGNEGASPNIPTIQNEAYNTSDGSLQQNKQEPTEQDVYYSSLKDNEPTHQEPFYNSLEEIVRNYEDHDYSYLEYDEESSTYDYTDEQADTG